MYWALVACVIVGCMIVESVSLAAADTLSNSEKYPLSRLKFNWSRSLKRGPNGPIPKIVVDQFGYPTGARKIAVIRSPELGYDALARFNPGHTYALVSVATGRILKKAPPVAWNNGSMHTSSGDKAWWFDFSDVVEPGKYVVVDIEKNINSVEFLISNQVYRNVMKHAVRMFFYQRAGFEKQYQFADANWADGASHLGPGQDHESRPWPATQLQPDRVKGAQVKDLRGGWYDAGDYNKYTSWAARNIIVLLRAFEENSLAFRDDLGIPESNNGIPDLLDEVKWGLDWLIRMQNDDGSLLCVQGLASGSPPSAAVGPSYYGPATTSASLMGAAVFAYASKIFATQQQPKLKKFAVLMAERAKLAWSWANANPSVRYYNNDDKKQPGSRGLAHGQQELGDADRLAAKVEAAVYLYGLSGETRLKDFIETNFASILPNHGPTMWDVDRQDIALYYSRLPDISSETREKIRQYFLAKMLTATNKFNFKLKKMDPYRSPIQHYTWGSNKGKAMQARLFQLTALHANDYSIATRALSAAMQYLHYIHGVNPLGLVYLTNMNRAGAEHSASTMFHAWFAQGTRWSKVSPETPGPPPGFLVGGPNSSFALDGCCFASGWTACGSSAAASICTRNFAPPLQQPPLKSYLQFNDSWPANSWSVSEPSDTYQAYYIRLLASFAR